MPSWYICGNERYRGPVFAAAPVGGGGSTNTWNPADTYSTFNTFSGGNLTLTKNTGQFFAGTRAIDSASSGKYYWEATINTLIDQIAFGVANATANLTGYGGNDNNQVGWAVGPASAGNVFLNNAFVTTIQDAVAGNTVCMAWDAGNQKIWFRTNGGNWNNAAIGSQDPASNVGGINLSTLNAGPYFAYVNLDQVADSLTANFGATAFAQTAPSGFTTWP